MASSSERMCESSRSSNLIVSLQIVSWCAVGALLLLRGVTTLRNESPYTSSAKVTVSTRNMTFENNETTSNSASDNEDRDNSTVRRPVAVRINPSSAILITVGTTMLVIGPTLLLARLIDSRRQHQTTARFTKVDPPPSYEEVAEKAPRYSALFQVTDTGEWVPIPTCEPQHSDVA